MFGKGGNGPDVVSMTEREREKRREALAAVERYWQSLCGSHEVPLRSQIDPRGMQNALEFAFLAERIAPSMAKLRVAGAHLSDLMGMEVAGMPLSSLIAPESRERLGLAVTQLFADPAILRIGLQAESGFGKPALEGELVILPLRSDMGDVSRALGGLVTTGRIGRTPRRFNITRIEVTPALEGIAEATPVSGPSPAPSIGFAEEAAPFESAPGKGPHLRLVVSND